MIARTLVATVAAVLVATLPTSAQTASLKHKAGPYELQVIVDGAALKTYQHRGETYVLGQLGARYQIRVVNNSERRVEVVASVDGRDVMDGKPGDYRTKRGYLVAPRGRVDIDGFRVSTKEVAAFRFSSVADSYAARIGGGREVGVIGVAIFPEREPEPQIVAVPEPTPRSEAAPGASQKGPPPPSAAPRAGSKSAAPSERPGLGTEFGERRGSRIQTVEFVREDAARPAAILGVRYNDRDGLLAAGVVLEEPRPTETELRRTADPFPGAEREFAKPPPAPRR